MECGEQGRGGERGAAVQVGKYRDRLHLKPPGRFVRTPSFNRIEMAGVDCVRKDSK